MSEHNIHEKSIGTRLKERRELLRANIEEIAQEIGVSAKHLRRIERDDWERLPSAVYTKGFVQRYAKKLGMDASRLVGEYEIKAGAVKGKLGASNIHNTSSGESIQNLFSSLSIPTTRRIIVGLIFLALIGYIGYQLSIVFADPELAIVLPVREETVVTQSAITLAGKTEQGVMVLLNNQQVEVSPEGLFEKEVELLPGINVLEVTAVSRFDERTTIRRTVIFQEPESPFIPQPVQDNNGTVGATTSQEDSGGISTSTNQN